MKMLIKGIEIQAVIGTLHHERNNNQKIVVDIEFEYDAIEAAKKDRLEFAVDYSKIVEETIKTAKESRFYLLEALCDKILDNLRNYHSITSARVWAKKPSAIKNIEYVCAEANF